MEHREHYPHWLMVRSTPLSRALLVLFIFVTAVFTLLAWRSQKAESQIRANQHRIESVQEARTAALAARARIDHQNCLTTADFLRKFRSLEISGITQAEAAPVSAINTKAMKAHNIAVLRDLLAHTHLIDCGPAPGP